jgi:hypothetical protein
MTMNEKVVAKQGLLRKVMVVHRLLTVHCCICREINTSLSEQFGVVFQDRSVAGPVT